MVYFSFDTALFLQISVVFVPNLFMFFAFWFWGVIEGEYSTGDNYMSINIIAEKSSSVQLCKFCFVLNCKIDQCIMSLFPP